MSAEQQSKVSVNVTATPLWHELAISLQVIGMIMLLLEIVRISAPSGTLTVMKLVGPEGCFLLVFLVVFLLRGYEQLPRLNPLFLAVGGTIGIIWQMLFAGSVIEWVMLASFLAGIVLLYLELFLYASFGRRLVCPIFTANTLLILWLYFDRMIFSVGRSHISLNHLLQLMHVAEEVKAAFLTFGKGHMSVFFELLLLVLLPVPLSKIMSRRATSKPRRAFTTFAGLALAVVLFMANYARFDAVCGGLTIFAYLPLRLDFGMLPVPDHPALRKAPLLQGLLQQQLKLDANRTFPKNSLAFRPDFKPVNLVMISVESMRRPAFDGLMAGSREFAERGLWLSNHFSVSNITFSSFHSIFRSSFPIHLAYTGEWATSIPLQQLLESASYSTLLLKPEKINMAMSNFWGSKTIEISAEPKWKNTPMVLDRLYEELRQPGYKAIHAYLYNMHYNYYYPPESEIHRPVIPEDVNLFAMQPDGDNLIGLNNRYANAAVYTDHLLADFLHKVESDGRFADTLFVIFGDHGESLGESGFTVHATGPHVRQFEAPAFFIGAGVVPRKVTFPTTHADLLPAICELMKINLSGSFGKELSSESDYPVLQLDEAVSGRIIVRHRDFMSVFDLSSSDSLKWLVTISNEFTIDRSVAGLYASPDFAALAEVIRADAEFIRQKIGKIL